VSLLREIFAQLIGEAAIEALSDPAKARALTPEGETNALLGAASALFGTIGFLSAMPAAVIAVFMGPSPSMGLSGILIFAVLGLAASYGALEFGRKGLRVTRRNRRLITFGVVLALPGLVLSIIALLASGIRVSI